MKRILILFATLLLALSAPAQTNSSVKEAGVVFSGLSRFGFTYRFGTEHALWRLNLLIASGSDNDNSWPDNLQDYHYRNYGFEFGKEFRNAIAPNIAFRYGADLSFLLSTSNGDTQSPSYNQTVYLLHYTSKRYAPGLQLVLGLNYTFHRVVIGAELHPYLRYNIDFMDSQNNLTSPSQVRRSEVDFGFNSNRVQMSVGYRL